MAAILLTLGKVCFALIGTAVGVRLLRDARAERGLGLNALASAAIFVGGTGLVLIPAGSALGEGGLGWWMIATGEWTMRGGMILLSIFVWRVFRPSGAGGIAGVAICGTMLVGTLVWDLHSQPNLASHDGTLPSAHANQLAIAMPLAWSCTETFLRWQRQKKQLALGLGDRLIAHNFALWTITTAAFVGVCLLANVAGLATARGASATADAAQIGRAFLYVVISVAIWAGMFPPAFLRARFDRA